MTIMATSRIIFGLFAESDFFQPGRDAIPRAAKAAFCAPIGGN
jgi:hypothetical protein